MTFIPFEATCGLGHFGIHNADNFVDILNEVTHRALAAAYPNKKADVCNGGDVNALNSQLFGVFDMLHLTYSEKYGNGKDDVERIKHEEKEAEENENISSSSPPPLSPCDGNGKETSRTPTAVEDIKAFGKDMNDKICEAASDLTDAVKETSTSLTQTLSSALNINRVFGHVL